MLPLIPFIPWGIGLLAGSVGITLSFYYLNKKKLKKIAKNNTNAISLKVKEILDKGKYKRVKVGLLDNFNNEIDEINIKTKSCDDLCKGIILKI